MASQAFQHAHSLHPSLFLHRRYITPGCLNATHWDAFYDFSQRAGADFIFGVAFGLEQACAGGGATPGPVRTSSAAPGTAYVWNATNAQTLLDYLAAKKQKIWGFEFGEKWRDSNRISRRVLARSLSGFSTLHNCRPVQCSIHTRSSSSMAIAHDCMMPDACGLPACWRPIPRQRAQQRWTWHCVQSLCSPAVIGGPTLPCDAEEDPWQCTGTYEYISTKYCPASQKETT